jgi:hypothetical protein
MRFRVRPLDIVNGHMDSGQRGYLRNVIPFRSLKVGGVGTPCIESPEVMKCDALFGLILWSWEWSHEWRDLTFLNPFLELGIWGFRGGSYVEVLTCEVSKHLLSRHAVTAHGRVEVKIALGA